MVKISVLQHAPSSHLPMRRGDPTPTSRNLDPSMHPFSKARERKRALNAAKLERIFAQPFVAALEGHIDAVEVLAKKPESLTAVASGSWDGEIILHDLARRTQLLRFNGAHKGKVSGLCWADEERLLSCGVDRTVKLWRATDAESSSEPLSVFPGKTVFNSIDHHRTDPLFATASNSVLIWDETKSAPISDLTFPTSTETITSVRFNLSEPSVLASIGTDRTFTLYDIRTGKAERRTIMQMRNNSLSWSPTFPTSVLLASEDHNLYTFDIRSMASPTQIYKAHVAAVMSCDWSPTGLEFVSGSWDRTVRIWKEGVGRSPEVYHTKRMQRVLSTVFTSDARFVVSGSDDGNVRIWKAKAHEKLGIITARERAAIEYRDTLKERWKHDAEVGKVQRSRHVPKPVYKAAELKRTMLEAQRVKEERRRKHTRAGASVPKAEKKKVVIAEQS
ncbi:WD40 repeat-like protein [Gloeophyllum trabeum ATCC 11539]|uniref:WD40 repeat-like protein n=1 Tax=Gloeophyllum trabeum (strain ATCC 11539 / FP-39264 / Madison 617) TaxID=670483 RepID=S7PW56_GLOTA|nr:WD40 repeat-like protein [Gloeophyllum trabeum ATCC 11539]EPQ51753.1 WD40 repeat-like protein [Gloeophyllum trabeum ATCC 11539]